MTFAGRGRTLSEAILRNSFWTNYSSANFFDEAITARGNPRVASRELVKFFKGLSIQEMRDRRMAAELAIREMGVSFTVYSDNKNLDREWPFDIIPRAISSTQWDSVQRGLKQRTQALNQFIDDVYNQQKIFLDGVVPRENARGNTQRLPT